MFFVPSSDHLTLLAARGLNHVVHEPLHEDSLRSFMRRSTLMPPNATAVDYAFAVICLVVTIGAVAGNALLLAVLIRRGNAAIAAENAAVGIETPPSLSLKQRFKRLREEMKEMSPSNTKSSRGDNTTSTRKSDNFGIPSSDWNELGAKGVIVRSNTDASFSSVSKAPSLTQDRPIAAEPIAPAPVLFRPTPSVLSRDTGLSADTFIVFDPTLSGDFEPEHASFSDGNSRVELPLPNGGVGMSPLNKSSQVAAASSKEDLTFPKTPRRDSF